MEVQEPRRSYGDEGAVARRVLGVGGGEDGVHEDERADDLGGEGSPDGVAGGHLVGAATEGVVGVLHDPLHDAHAADGAQALRHDVQQGAHQRQLPPHEQPERHGRVDVPQADPKGGAGGAPAPPNFLISMLITVAKT